MKPKIVVLTGAGVSAESGLATFRGADGLWEGHRVEDVATPEAFDRNPQQVLEFYNQRRRQAINAQPNAAHKTIKALEELFDVVVITQNVDHLHEKAGSSHVLHLHGKLFESRSTLNQNAIYDIRGTELAIGDLAPDGSQLRPNIVWFGEAVPMMEPAIEEVTEADALVVVGTSLQVYPAASLVDYVGRHCPIFVVDPNTISIPGKRNVTLFSTVATEGMARVADHLKLLFYPPPGNNT